MTIATGSLRFRFLASNLVWIAVCGVVAALLISGMFRRGVERGYHDEMEVHIEELAALTAFRPDGQPYLLRRLSDPRFLPARSGMYWQVERPGFRTLASPSLGAARLDNRLASGPEVRFDWVEGPMGTTLEYGRAVAASGGGPPIKLLMASDRRLVDETMADFDRSLGYCPRRVRGAAAGRRGAAIALSYCGPWGDSPATSATCAPAGRSACRKNIPTKSGPW